MSARVQCFSCTAPLLVLYWDLPPPGISIISVSISVPPGPGYQVGGGGTGWGGLGGGAAVLFTAPHLIVHLAKYSW